MGFGTLLYVVFKVIVLWIQAFIEEIFPPAKKSIDGQVILITGTGHGIGREMCLQLARLAPSAKLVLWDLNKENNEATAADVRKLGGQAHSYICDVSNSADIHSVAEKMRKDVGDVDILINNAGILNGGSLHEMEERHIRRIFEVNTLAHFWTVREFLPAMMEKNRGHIVNISSLAAFEGVPLLVDYCATKSAVASMTYCLRKDLMWFGKSGVKTSVVYFSFADTGMVKVPKTKYGTVLPVDEIVKGTIDGILREQEEVFVPGSTLYLMKLAAVYPRRVRNFLVDLMEVYIEPQYHVTKKD